MLAKIGVAQSKNGKNLIQFLIVSVIFMTFSVFTFLDCVKLHFASTPVYHITKIKIIIIMNINLITFLLKIHLNLNKNKI